MESRTCQTRSVNSELEYVEHDHREVAFVTLQELRRDGMLCDVTLVAEGRRLSAHRVVLAATVPYFRAMFTLDMMEKTAAEITIQVIGGQYGIELLDSVEVFYAQENRWIFSKELPEVRVSCASVYLNGRVYVIGGSNGTCITRTVYCFDINSGQWSKLANIKEPRRYLGAAVLNEKIYVVGGSNHAGPLCSAECYDLRQDMWTPVANMNVRRSMLGVVEYDGCLFAFGGFDVHDPLCTSEVYNPKQNEWQFLSASNGIQGSCTAATVPIINTL